MIQRTSETVGWTGTTPMDVGTHPAAQLVTDTVDNVAPLDDQLGVTAPLTTPPALRDALFAPDPKAGQLFTYAILDGGKIWGLPEMLEASDLQFACLFQGDAEEELRDVAPYLVRLDEKSRFTRGLFTAGDAPWQMWDREPGMYFRASLKLVELRRHFRKFTRVRDETGNWFYLRFWEPSGAEQTFAALSADGVRPLFQAVESAYAIQVHPSVCVRRFRLMSPSA